MEAIKVVGIGPGTSEYLSPVAIRTIENADILIGGHRLLETFAYLDKKVFPITNNLPQVLEFIRNHRDKNLVVLASGDPGLFGILTFLRKHFSVQELQVIPGISSIQLACARLALPWEDAILASVHGREMAPLLPIVQQAAKVVVLTDRQATPAAVAQFLTSHGWGAKMMAICANLGYPSETIITGQVQDMVGRLEFESCVVVITNE